MGENLPIKINLPEHFLDEEVRCGYTVSEKMKRIWAVELDLLAELDRVCRKYNIIYYADGGTLLGAVRHKGFIPWDDDIDVMLFRSEYDRLCQHSSAFQSPYFFQTEYTDPGSRRTHAQLRNSSTTGILKSEYKYHYAFNQGIFLDIFPIDHVPDDEKLLDRQVRKAKKYKHRCDVFFDITGKGLKLPHNPCKRLIYKFLIKSSRFRFVRKILDHQREYRRFERMISKYNDIETKQVATYFGVLVDGERSVWLKDDFSSIAYLPFEFLHIPAPSGYVGILNKLYQNEWEKFKIGTSMHGGVYFNTSIPYKEYFETQKNGPLLEEMSAVKRDK